MTKKQIDQTVHDLHENFPFEEIRCLYVLFKLNFAFHGYGFPSVGDLKEVTDRLIRNVCYEVQKDPYQDYFNQQGYFRVGYLARNKRVTLSFVLFEKSINV